MSIAGADCVVQSESSTEIICETDEPADGSQKSNVLVQVDDAGVSLMVSFSYFMLLSCKRNPHENSDIIMAIVLKHGLISTHGYMMVLKRQ